MTHPLSLYSPMIQQACLVEMRGRVSRVQGLALRVADLPVPVGARVHVYAKHQGADRMMVAEVIGFDDTQTIVMPLGSVAGISRGDEVVADQFTQTVSVGEMLLGRVIDALGRPIDDQGPLEDLLPRSLVPDPLTPLNRPPIDTPLATGVRAIDCLLSVGRGQRIGVFAPPGLGKSTLLGMMAKHTAADVSVIALVGERGREVRDFVENQLGDQGMSKTVVVCATGDESPLLRIRAALTATTIAEYFRDHGQDVLLIMDSITRFCQAQRQVGLAAGEPPATKGYPPSVFAMLPALLERSGRTDIGSITGFYAVLSEGDELADPITEAAKGILDGHVQLSRDLANRGHWPAIDVLTSVSRVASRVTPPDHQAGAREVLKLVADYRRVEDLVNIGAYAAGSNPDFDLAIACQPVIDQLLQQGQHEVTGACDFGRTQKQLLALAHKIRETKQQLAQTNASNAGRR